MSTKTLKRAIDKILTKDAEFKVGQKVRYRDKPMPAIFVKYLSDTEAVVRSAVSLPRLSSRRFSSPTLVEANEHENP